MLVPASIIEPNVGHASLAIPPVEEYDEELYILEVRFVDWNAGAKTDGAKPSEFTMSRVTTLSGLLSIQLDI